MRSWGVIPEAVPLDRVKAARRAINAEVGRTVRAGGGMVGDAYGHTWLPNIRETDPITALRTSLPFGDVPCEPQIVLGFPLADDSHQTPLHAHIDTLPPWADGRPYSVIVGVALTKWTVQNGTLHVWDNDFFTPVPLAPGDAVWMKPDVKHTAGHNLTSDARIGVYFRWLVDSKRTISPTVATSTN